MFLFRILLINSIFLICDFHPISGQIFFESVDQKDAFPLKFSNFNSFPSENRDFSSRDVIGSSSHDMCREALLDVNGDMTTKNNDLYSFNLDTSNCQKNYTIVLFRKPDGYQIDASLNRTPIDLFQNFQNNLTIFTLPSGSLTIQITQTDPNVTSFHLLVIAGTTDYKILASKAFQPDNGPWMAWQFKPGTTQKSLIYQGNTGTLPAQAAIEMQLFGDCPIRLWKGLFEDEESIVYGGVGTVCGKQFYRHIFPKYIFERYLILELNGTNQRDCNISMHSVTADSTRNINQDDVLTFPSWTKRDSIGQTFTYHLANMGTEKGINLDLMALPGGTNLTIDDQSGTPFRFPSDGSQCQFRTESMFLSLEYTWTCPPGLTCGGGALLRYSVGSDDFYSTTPSTPSTSTSTSTSILPNTTTNMSPTTTKSALLINFLSIFSVVFLVVFIF